MPAIKKSDVLEDSVKKAFDDLNASVRLSVDLLVLMTKSAKDINASLGNGSNMSQIAAAYAKYNNELKEQAKSEQDVLKAKKLKAEVEAKNAKATEAKIRASETERKATEAQAKATEREVKASEKAAAQAAKEASEYYKLSKAYSEASRKAQEMGAAHGKNSKQFIAARDEANKLRGQLNGINRDLGKYQDNVGNYASGWKSFGAGLLGGFGITLGLTAIVGGIKSVIQSSMAFEKSLSSLRAITGVTAKEMEFFRQKALMMSKDSVKSATEIVKAFELVGSKAPELLKNKEALAAVTDQSIILSEATGGKLGLEESVNAVTAAMNTFGISSLEAGRIAAVFAAGSKEGSAEVSSLTESFKNAGTVAASANMTFEETVAMLEVMGEKSIYGADAGTKLKGSIMKLQQAQLGYQSGSFNLRDALDEMNKKVASLGSEMERTAYITDVFQSENVTTGTIMLQNVDKFDKLTKAVTGTNTAIEQQARQNDNLSTSAAKLGNAWDSWMISLNNSNGVLKSILDYVTKVIDKVSQLSMNEAALSSSLAGKGFAELNKQISSLSINEQIGALEADLKKMNAVLKNNAQDAIEYKKSFEAAFNESVYGKAWQTYDDFVKAMFGSSDINAEQILSANKEYVKLVQDRLNALYAEQMKQEDGTKAIKEDTEATKENTAAKKEANKQAMEPTPEPKEMKSQGFKGDYGLASDVFLTDKSDTQEAVLASAMDFASKETQIYQDALDQQIASLEAAEARKAAIRQRWADEISTGIGSIEDAMWDNVAMSREDAMNAEIEANQKRLDNENLDEEQRKAIQKQNDERERQLKIKNAKAEKQEALFRIGIDTAIAIMKAWAVLGPLAVAEIPFIVAQGAMQAAAVGIRKIPEYAEGTDNHPGGMAVVGDGGKSELVETPSGARFLTPATDTIVNLPKGSKVTPGEEVAERLNELTRRELIGLSLPSTVDRAQHALLTRLIDEQIRTRDAIKNQPQPKAIDVRGAIKLEMFKQSLKN